MTYFLRSFWVLILWPAAAVWGQENKKRNQPPPVQFVAEAGAHYFFKTGSLADNLDPEIENVAQHQRKGFAWSGEAGVVLGGQHHITVVRTQSSRSKDFSLGLVGPGGGAFFPANSTEDLAYTGLNYGTMLPLGKKSTNWIAIVKAGLGVWSYRNEVTINAGSLGNSSGAVKENGFGYMAGFRIGYQLSPSLAWFAGTDLLGGSVKVEDEQENLSQIRLSTTLRITLPGG